MRATVVGGDGVARDLREILSAASDRAVNAVVRETTAALLTRIRRNASTGHHSAGTRGRHIPGTGPGPNVDTGTYRRSWRAGVTGSGGTTIGRVETDAVQAWRLEYGFVGADSLGRVYHQPPYPHVGPAVDATEREFVAALAAAVNRLDDADPSGPARAVSGRIGRPT